MKSHAAAILFLAGLFSAGATGAAETYFGLQYGMTTYEENRVPELDPVTGIFRLGGHGPGRYDLEARLGIGLEQGDARLFGTASAGVEVDSLYGVYAVVRLGAFESFSAYGVAGISRVEVTTTASLGAFSDSLTRAELGPSFGAGVEYGGFGEFALNLEFMSYVSGDQFSASVIGLGLLF